MITRQKDMPTALYRMGFLASPLDPQSSILWTNVGQFNGPDGIQRMRVLGRSSSAGRQQGQDNVDTSRATYTMDNLDGAFIPSNTASPYYPNVKLDVIFQEFQSWNGAYAVFTGFVDDIAIRSDVFGNPIAVLSCSDASKHLNLDVLESSVWKMEVRKDVSANITAGNNTAWIRLNDPNSSEVASDYGGLGFDGNYQGGPILGQVSIIPGDTDTCMDVAHSADQRANLPYKYLLTQFPSTIETVVRCFPNRAEAKYLWAAESGPGFTAAQLIECRIDNVTGTVIAQAGTNYPTRTKVISTLPVDDGITHHVLVRLEASDTITIWIDGTNSTVPLLTTTFGFPDDLSTGYSIANTPASTYGDFGLNAGTGTDNQGNEIVGGIQSTVFYDGLLMSPARIQAHAQAAIVGWGTVTSGSRVDQVLDMIGWPSADRAVDAGVGTIGNLIAGGTPLAYLQLVAETEGGRFFISPEGYPSFHSRTRPLTQTTSLVPQAIFDDSGAAGTVPYVPPFEPHLDDVDLWYRASVQRINGNPQVYDATPGSTTTRTRTRTGLLMPTDTEARGRAQYDVSVGKRQLSRLRSLTFQPQLAPDVGWPAALGLRQGYRVRTNRTYENTAGTWTADWIVEGIKHDCQSGLAPWTTTLTLSPVDPATYFVLGTSELGGSDELFY